MVLRIWLALVVAVALLAPGLAAADQAKPAGGDAARLCLAVAEANLLDPSVGWLRPSPDYLDGNWLRDAFWTTGALGPLVGRRALDHFGRQVRPEGQAPTRLGLDGNGNQYFDDESTLLYVLWAYRDGGQPPGRLARAWSWVGRHVKDGAYWTPPGNFRTWHDSFAFPADDVAAYNQGLYAAAALAAERLGIATAAEAQGAVAFYRHLYRADLGYLPFSFKLAYRDPSALVGETLARTLLGESLLADAAVLSTVDHLRRVGPGFRALAAADGAYLAQSAFSPSFPPGDYHNGGSWLLYDVLAWQAAALAGSPSAQQTARERLAFEVAWGSLYEYWTTSDAGLLKGQRRDYAWNAYACRALDIEGLPSLSRDLQWASLPVPY